MHLKHINLKFTGFLSDGLEETRLAFNFAIKVIQEDESFTNLDGG